MTDKDPYIAKAKARIDQWDAEIDKVKAKAEEAEADAKIEYRRQADEMRAQRNKAESRLQDLRAASNDAWENLKSGFETAWKDISSAFDSAKSRYQ
ncbi:coiled coil domain-containing protein [Nisaea acidiphila]|uniref:Coiled coil domain-containing protein n=1 Tax=Nisaea acidiphila TaxID=1862145 RepID=A0A9J7ATY2_9PROT|nr:coiled coil domain-containing protein [Nisaea acidiphila]UUX51171.1 coiled coil domain-containing protein [Nisaea acidiphila]